MTNEPHVHIFSEDGDCIDPDCDMWRSLYIAQLEQRQADLLAMLEYWVDAAQHDPKYGGWLGKARDTIARMKETR